MDGKIVQFPRKISQNENLIDDFIIAVVDRMSSEGYGWETEDIGIATLLQIMAAARDDLLDRDVCKK